MPRFLFETHDVALMIERERAGREARPSAGVRRILDAISERRPWIKTYLADVAYGRGKIMDRAAAVPHIPHEGPLLLPDAP